MGEHSAQPLDLVPVVWVERRNGIHFRVHADDAVRTITTAAAS
jgi:hypothetical protein